MPYKTKEIFDKGLLRYFICHLLFLIVIFYFIYHALSGERGYIKMLDLREKIAKEKSLFTELSIKEEKLDNKVKLLYPESLSKDMIDELARSYFNLIGKNEILILKGDIEHIQKKVHKDR